MLQPTTLKFLTLLNDNNNKVWFDDNRMLYENAKQDFEQFIDDVLQANAVLIPELASKKAKQCVFRIYKDVRFSKDKVPYKNNFGAAFGKGEKKVQGAAFYIHLQPGGHSFVGGGIWMPDALGLKAIRQEIDYSFEKFLGVIHKPSFLRMFGGLDQSQQLKKCPKDYTDDNPALAFLKLKSFTVGTSMSDKDFTSKDAVAKITGIVAEMKPFVDFLNAAIL